MEGRSRFVMSQLSQIRDIHEETEPAWEEREDETAVMMRSTRRKKAPDSNQEALDSLSPSPHSSNRTNSPQWRELSRTRHRDVALSKPDPEASHATTEERIPHSPLHYFENDMTSSENENFILTGLAKHHQNTVLQYLQEDRQPSFGSEKKCEDSFVEGQKVNNDEISTASTSGSNSSSSSSMEQSNPKFDTSLITSARDSDCELEQYSRQIRMELRQAEMLELAAEAERAAAAGRKSFSGRASTFGDDSEIDLPTETPHMRKATPVTRQRPLDFGTPLTRRSQPEQCKISVVALRDVAEVVPCFKDFHTHLRTHLARRRVNEDVLCFEEVDGPSAPESTHSSTEQNMIDLLSSFNFGNWASSNRTLPDDNAENDYTGKAATIEEKPSESSAASAIGDLLAEHTPLRGSRKLQIPKVEVPPGLKLASRESLSEQGKGVGPCGKASGEKVPRKVNHGRAPCTPQPTRATDAAALGSSTTRSTKSHAGRPGRKGRQSFPIQDGSPNSPIIVDDIYDEGTPERKSTKDYRSQSPIPGLPLTPKENFQDIFESQFTTPRESKLQSTIGSYYKTQNDYDFRDNLGCDFDTPVRLRDMRDEHLYGGAKFMAKLPRTPLLTRPKSSNATADQNGTPYDNVCNPESNANAQENSFEITGQLRRRDLGRERLSDRFDKLAEPQLDAALADSTLDITSDCSEQNEKSSDFTSLREESGYAMNGERGVGRHSAPQIPDDDGNHMVFDDTKQIIQCASMPVLEGASASSAADPICIRKGYSYDMPHHVSSTNYEQFPVESGIYSGNNEDVCNDTLHDRCRLSKPGTESLHDGDCHVGRVIGSSNIPEMKPIRSGDTGDRPNVHDNSVIDMNGMEPSPRRPENVEGDSNQANQSKGTGDFRCECLISPASSLESEDEDGMKVSSSRRNGIQNYSAWNLMESPKDGNHQSLQAAVAMFSKISPTGGSSRRRLNLASSKENDDFMSNYLYCSKAQESSVPNPEPACAAPPCQETQMPCGDIAVDTCVGNFLETTLKFLPKKSTEGKKLLNLSRDKVDDMKRKPVSWYDMANERFDRLLERIMGNEHAAGSQWQTFQAPTLREKKTPTPPETPPRHGEVYDEDLGGVILIQNSNSLDTSRTSTGPTGHSAITEKPRLQRRFHLQNGSSPAEVSSDRRLHHALSDSVYHRYSRREAGSDSSYLLDNRHSM